MDIKNIYGSQGQRLDSTSQLTPSQIEVWRSIKRSSDDFKENNKKSGNVEFLVWLEDTWGIEVLVSAGQFYNVNYKIVDEEKFLLFILKYNS